MNSVQVRPAPPMFRTRRRNVRSVTPSMGASTTLGSMRRSRTEYDVGSGVGSITPGTCRPRPVSSRGGPGLIGADERCTSSQAQSVTREGEPDASSRLHSTSQVLQGGAPACWGVFRKRSWTIHRALKMALEPPVAHHRPTGGHPALRPRSLVKWTFRETVCWLRSSGTDGSIPRRAAPALDSWCSR